MSRPLVVGKGSALKSKTQKNVYYIRHNMGKDPITAKYRYSPRRKVYAKNKSELRAELEAYKAELNSGLTIKDPDKTVYQYTKEFHKDRVDAETISPLALDREELEVKEIQELFGNYPVKDLRPHIINAGYAEARKSGRFSESELHKISVKLNQIMKAAMLDDLIVKNPCAGTVIPRPKGKERQALSLDEARRLLSLLLSQEMDSHRIGTLLLLDTGMRRGEMLGLRWGDVHFGDGYVRIDGQYAADKLVRDPKSSTGKRSVSLSPLALERLAAWRELQRTLLAEVDLEQASSTPIVHTLVDPQRNTRAKTKDDEKGKRGPIAIAHMDPNCFSRWFREWCSDYGFGQFREITHYIERDGKMYARGTKYSGLTPHMLRHTQATLLIGENVDIKTVSSRLGHSTVKLTLDTYAHAIAAKDQAAANTIGNLLSN